MTEVNKKTTKITGDIVPGHVNAVFDGGWVLKFDIWMALVIQRYRVCSLSLECNPRC
ncbi:hypothetical protein ACFL0R_02705 [Pseudomonadota bacterium]